MPAPDGPSDAGRYHIGRLLGRGGLGEVYLAHDRTLDRDVAIKFLSPGKIPDSGARHALLREARAAAALDHPFICTVYEAAETADGRAFIAMQYIEGETLSDVLQRGPMPVRDALALCADIADALAAAHRRGVIHRDLKPGNIMVTPAGRPKLVDFGIATVPLPPPQALDAVTVTGSITAASTSPGGTPAYMSPEQVQRRTVDGRSDLFALGLVLFECLTGRRAFRAPTPVETAAEILHVYPPAPSSLRAGLTDAHDELCRRLLAKDPADRFQSAEEVVGAIRVLLPDTSRTSSRMLPPGPRLAGRRRVAVWVLAVLALAGIGGGVWRWSRGTTLPPVPEASDVWYRRGSEALREGAYYRAKLALEQAVQIFPQHALAHARLAEVATELDDPAAAREHLLRVSQMALDEDRLPAAEALRLQAVRALALRDVDRAVARYRSLVQETRSEPRALVDLGRAEEAAGRRAAARESYSRAIAADRQYAVAHLRLATLEGLESRWEPARTAYAEAERLYKAGSDVEGEAEVLLNRGAMLDQKGEPRAARQDLERAQLLAATSKSISQKVRTQLALSVVTASEGQIAEAERLAAAAVDEALANELDTVAAGGLIDLAATLLFGSRPDTAETHLQRALVLAGHRGATLTIARAKLQLAEVYSRRQRAAEALALIGEVLPFLQEKHYRRYELTALTIAAGAHEQRGELDVARRMASEVLAIADTIGDENQAAIAASSLASVTTVLGGLPEALRLRERADAIHRRQGDKSALPWDLTNRAELLIRLGRQDEARALLAELDAGIQAGIDSYVNRRRRATFLRGMQAAIELKCGDALPWFDRLDADGPKTDSTAILAPAIRQFCLARPGPRRGPPSEPSADADLALARERQYWLAAAALRRGDPAAASAEADRGLALLGDVPNDELRWRLAAVGAAAASRRRDGAAAARLASTATDAQNRLKTAWKTELDAYARRPDLSERWLTPSVPATSSKKEQ